MTTSTPTSSGSWRRRIGLVASGLVVAFLAWKLVDGWDEVRRHQWDVNGPLLVASVVVLAVFFVCGGLAYLGVVRSLVTTSWSAPGVLRAWAVSLLGRYVPGSVVMVVGRVEMSHPHGVPRRVSAAALVYEQALGLGVAALASLAWVLAYGATGSAWSVLAVVAAVALLAILHPRVFGPLSHKALTAAKRPPLERLIPEGRVVLLAVWFAITASLLGLGVWLAMRALGGDAVGSLPYVSGAFLFAFTVSMMLVIFPSGLGVRDGAFALALAQNVPQGVAVALSVSSRLLLTVVELAVVAGIVVWTKRRPS